MHSYNIRLLKLSNRKNGCFKFVYHFITKSLKFVELQPNRIAGLKVRVPLADASHLLIYIEVFEEGAYDLSFVQFLPDLVVDCGAHVGYFSLLASQSYPVAKLIAVEPDTDNLALLRHNIEQNELKISVLNGVVGLADGNVEFLSGESCSGRVVGEVSPRSTSVVQFDLRRIISEHNPERLLLKVDIEGGEESLLPAIASILPAESVVFFETHNGSSSWTSIKSMFMKYGFEVKLLSDRGKYKDGVAVRSTMTIDYS